jgi:hypothetical protein
MSHNPFRNNVTNTIPLPAVGVERQSALSSIPPPIPPRPSSPGIERDVPESNSSSSGLSRSPSPSTRSLMPRDIHSSPSQGDLQEILRAESPPPYTPAADLRHGETTIEVGPRRPFQQPPATAMQHAPPIVSPWQRMLGASPGNSGWSAYPGSLQRQQTGASFHPPPPQHPLSPLRGWGQNSAASDVPGPPARATSDFARDFYAAGADDSGLLGGASAQYAPPPGPPPRSSGDARSSVPSGLSNSSDTGSGTSDDGRPTSKPVPGHPLMNSGKVLVYPSGYECPKCEYTNVDSEVLYLIRSTRS